MADAGLWVSALFAGEGIRGGLDGAWPGSSAIPFGRQLFEVNSWKHTLTPVVGRHAKAWMPGTRRA